MYMHFNQGILFDFTYVWFRISLANFDRLFSTEAPFTSKLAYDLHLVWVITSA